MKFTIDTNNKTITLHGSFKFEEFTNMRRGLHPSWLDFTITVEPVVYNWPMTWINHTGSPLEPPFNVTCSTPVDTATGQHKLNFGE